MKKINRTLYLVCLLFIFTGCENDEVGGGEEWLIPENEVFDGGPGKDGIPSVDNPDFTDIGGGDVFLAEDELVVGLVNNGIARAYPHAILNWHEIVNDDIGDISVAVTYCPLTGTAIGWDRNIDGGKTTFGVSGLLYNTNLLPYDRKTNSTWSQMRLDCVNGNLIGTEVGLHHLVETTWSTWKAMYPDTEVLSTNTGFNRNYNGFPYGDYITNNNRLFFPISNEDERLPQKERVLGVVINDKAKVYSVNDFGTDIKVVEDQIENVPVVVVGSNDLNFLLAFESKTTDGTNLSFTAVQDQLPVVLIDNEGNEWDVFGNAVSGPRQGQRLTTTTSYIGYFFAWGTFHPGLDIYQR